MLGNPSDLNVRVMGGLSDFGGEPNNCRIGWKWSERGGGGEERGEEEGGERREGGDGVRCGVFSYCNAIEILKVCTYEW